MAIGRKDISGAATAVLRKEFAAREVYSDETQEGFALPAFFIEIIQTTSNVTLNVNANRVTIVITYLSKKPNTIDNMDTADRIKRAFGLILPVGNRKLKINDLETTQTGERNDILQIYLRMEYFEVVEREETHDIAKKLKFRFEDQGE